MAEAREATKAACVAALERIDLADDEPYVAVRVECPSTGHKHLLRVPPGTRTCLQGVAWTFDMAPEDYLTLVEA